MNASMTSRAIFYHRHGTPAPHTRVVSADGAKHLPDRILAMPGGITDANDGIDAQGHQVYREHGTD